MQCTFPPSSSAYFDQSLFDELNDDIAHFTQNNHKIILAGDFNARTANKQDFINNDGSHFTNTQYLSSEITTNRHNCDGETNSNGHLLLDICKSQNLRIINGRKIGDSLGNFTCHNRNKGSSTVDYAITTDNFFNDIDSFLVKPQTPISDHCQIVSWLSLQTNPIPGNQKLTYKWNKIRPKFRWQNNLQ